MKTGNSKLHPDDLRVERNSDALAGVKVALCLGGGIAAIEAPKVARELRRKGALVQVYATENTLKFVGKDALEWASTQPVVVSSSGLAEHIATDDLVLVMPATADLISKAAQGICPDACSTYIQSALGFERPIYFVPTMHDSLRHSPAFKLNLEKLRTFAGVELLTPRIEEGKWKSPRPEEVVLEVAHRFNARSLFSKRGKKFKALVTLGGTSVPIDSARSITNASSGFLGSLIAERLIEAGVETTALCGVHSVPLPECSGLKKVEANRFEDFEKWIDQELDTNSFDALFHVAAISDFKAAHVSAGKIESGACQALQLEPLPKLIKHKNLKRIPFKVACKYTASNSPQENAKALQLLNDNGLDAVYWNWGSQSFGTTGHSEGLILLPTKEESLKLTSKHQAAKQIAALFMIGK